MSESVARKYDDFDETFLEERTGIKGWGTRFTSVAVLSRDDQGSNPLYYPLLSYVQANFEKLHGEELPGFDYRYLSRGFYPPLKTRRQQNSFEAFYQLEKLTEEERKAKEEREKEERKLKGVYEYNKFTPGLGMFKLTWKGETLYLLHQHHQNMVNSAVLFVEGRNRRAFVQELFDVIMHDIAKAKVQPPLPHHFQIYKYKPGVGWKASRKGMARSLESVVLPQSVKDEIMEDLDDFLNEQNKQWFMERGIPYKRCYLFYGVPGSGKTSLISVIAGMYDRCVCYLSPTSWGMNDDKLTTAVNTLPQRAILVIEDVDGLFTKSREKKVRNELTFSGMLNALDGVGMALGQVIILSTNFRERLDAALIRNGRVDKQIKFDYMKPPEIRKMFKVFYKNATEGEQDRFLEAVEAGRGPHEVSAAMLQQVFISCFKDSKHVCLARAEEEIRHIIEQAVIDETPEEEGTAEAKTPTTTSTENGKVETGKIEVKP